MGTNFYLNKEHVGKRSAAGLYCWDCRLTLCRSGESMVHFGGNRDFFLSCPKCGVKPKTTCCSFSWAMKEDDMNRRLARSRKPKPIIDEYENEYTIEEFGKVLDECPIRYFHSIGMEFE